MSSINGTDGTVSMIIVVCLNSSHGHNERPIEQLNKIRVASMTVGIHDEAIKNRKVRDCVQIQLVTFAILFSAC